jgi:metal-responsive CopG/Arc/MetJ family transcriptional regulator
MRQRTSITVDDFLWRRFRATVALEGKDMSPVLEQLIEDYLREHETTAREAATRNQEERR